MTGTRKPQQDGSIQAMLSDSGLETATELRSTLEQLQALVPEQAPAPRADLAALLSAGSGAAAGRGSLPASSADALPAGVSSLAERRHGRKRRMALISGAVVGAMTLGAGAVAASSQDFRENVGHTLTVIFQPAAPSPAPTPSSTAPADLPAPIPAGTSAAVTVPAGPAPVATVPASKHPVPLGTPPAVGRGGMLPKPEQRPVTPGFPGPNGRGIPASPLPTVPGIPERPTSFSGQP